jgi:hypothetical protein
MKSNLCALVICLPLCIRIMFLYNYICALFMIVMKNYCSTYETVVNIH